MHFSSVMAPNYHFVLNSVPLEPVSRTYQYRKIMKPMLERKRRARINKCLDELKDLMMGTLQADGENISKLEKADILELTVRHLQRLRENNALFVRNDSMNVEKFWAGFQHCATEVAQFLSKYDCSIGGDLIKHIISYTPKMVAATATAAATSAATTSKVISATTTATTTTTSIATVENYQKYSKELSFTMPPPTTTSTTSKRPIKSVKGSFGQTNATQPPLPSPVPPLLPPNPPDAVVAYRKQLIFETNGATPAGANQQPSTVATKIRVHPYARLSKAFGGSGDGGAVGSGNAVGECVWRPW